MDFKVHRNDIAKMPVDVVVLSANWRLRPGTGASYALFEAAGRKELEAECQLLRADAERHGMRLKPGVCIPSRAFALPAKTILHTIVPKWRPKEARKCSEELCMAYVSALTCADEMSCESIAFPLLAAGNNGFDAGLAIELAEKSIEQYEPKNKLSEVYLVVFDPNVTQKMRDAGYEVDELIDQTQVLDQTANQLAWLESAKETWAKEKEANKPLINKMVDEGRRWARNPKNLVKVASVAVDIASVVLPTAGGGAVARKVLKAAKPFLG